jgi:phage baseplate assembly protein gpV
MKTTLIYLLVSAAAISYVPLFAQARPTSGQADTGVSRSAVQSTPPSATTLSERGTIEKYDRSTRTLSLSTSSGTVQFRVASTTRIRQGWHKVDASELEKLVGNPATVRYTESGANKLVESVHVFRK